MQIKYPIVLFMILGGLFACQKADLSAIDNLRENEIGIVGHGGMGFSSAQVNLPSNSLEGIIKAVEGYAVDGVEVDVQLSEDGKLFLYHDSRLQSLTDCIGCLYQKESDELDACKYVSGFNTQHFNTQNLVRLDVIVERFSARTSKPMIFLDLKTSLDCSETFDNSVYEQEYIAALKELFLTYDCKDWVIVESPNLGLLIEIQNEIPDVLISYFTSLNEAEIETASLQNFFGLSANFDEATAKDIRLAHDQGLFITLGILKIRRDAIDMINKSPDFIYTDNIPLLQTILN